MNKEKSSGNSGIGLGSAMFLLFLALKLTGYIAWSWWWVTAPLWAGIVIVLLVALIAVLAKG